MIKTFFKWWFYIVIGIMIIGAVALTGLLLCKAFLTDPWEVGIGLFFAIPIVVAIILRDDLFD
jgi:hypothetical protein